MESNYNHNNNSDSRFSSFLRSLVVVMPSPGVHISEPPSSTSISQSSSSLLISSESSSPTTSPFSFLGLSALFNQLPTTSFIPFVSSTSSPSPSSSSPPSVTLDTPSLSSPTISTISPSEPPLLSPLLATSSSISLPTSPPHSVQPDTLLTTPIPSSRRFRKDANLSSTETPSPAKSFGTKTREALAKLKRRPCPHRSLSSVSSMSMSPSEKTFSTISSASSFAIRPNSIRIKSSRCKSRPRHLSGLILSFEAPTDLLTGRAIFALEYSPQPSTFLAAAGETGIIHVFDTLNRNPTIKLLGHTNTVTSLSWTASTRHLISASMDKTVRIWDIEKRLEVGRCVHPDFVTTIISDPQDEDLFLSGSIDRKLRLWRISSSKLIACTELSDCITSLTFSSTSAITGLYSGVVLAFDPRTLKIQKRIITKPGRKVTSLIPLPNQADQLLVATNDSRIRILLGGQSVKEFRGHRSEAGQLKASIGLGLGESGQDLIASGSEDGRVYVWELGLESNSQESFRVIDSGSVTCVVFKPTSDGVLELAVADDRTGLIRIYRHAWRSLQS